MARGFEPALIAAVDIGSPKKGNLGWAVLESGETGQDMERLVALVSEGLAQGPVALGFEAPLWVPARNNPMTLTNARQGEGSRAWCAGGGAGALATGLVVITYIMTLLRKAAPNANARLDYRNPPSQKGELLVWEAFVSGETEGKSHEIDALIAARAFRAGCSELTKYQKLTTEPNLNLIGAILLRTGWSTDLSMLQAETLVVNG